MADQQAGIKVVEQTINTKTYKKCGRNTQGVNSPCWGKKLSDEEKKKISEARKKQYANGFVHPLLGKKHSAETKAKISKSRTGKTVGVNNPRFGKKHTAEAIEKMQKAHKGAMVGEKHWCYGKPLPEKTRQKQLEVRAMQIGVKNPNWRGGKSFEPYGLTWTETLKKSIRQRDGYTCQLCGTVQSNLKHDVHHIDYDKQNNNPDNLITLCKSCHSKTNGKREYWLKYFTEVHRWPILKYA